MRRRIGVAVLVLLVAILSGLVWLISHRGVRKPAPLESQWHTEEEWLVDSVVRDIAEMARFAAVGQKSLADKLAVAVRRPASGGNPVHVLVVLAPGVQVERDLSMATFVWSPHEYSDLAKALFDAAGVKAAPQSTYTGGESVITSLTDLQPAPIEQANVRVSGALAARFMDPALHESAALVVAAFALREAAGPFSDSRASLCRITAHLAVASVLGGDRPRGLEGRVAEAVLLVLAGRGADARSALDELDRRADPGAGAQAWRTALRVRLTQDTRRITPRTLIERREMYRALMRTTEERAALPSTAELAEEDLADWWRLAQESGWSVQMANAFLEHALDQEVAEMQEVWTLVRKLRLQESWLVPALNERAERCVTRAGPRAIAWGTWAAFFQRHILRCLWVKYDHLSRGLGLPDRAKSEFEKEGPRFSGLTLYPILQVGVEQAARSKRAALYKLVILVARRPELVNAAYFSWASKFSVRGPLGNAPPDARPWFSPALPRGTTYDVFNRREAGLVPKQGALLRVLHAISPDDRTITFSLVRSLKTAGAQADVGEAERILGARLEYDIDAIGLLAELTPQDLAARNRIYERQCALSAPLCFDWAHGLVESGDREAAAKAYERALAAGLDEVRISTESRWLLNYYLDVGARSEAEALAKRVASTGSAAGMISMSRYLERTGEIEKAEAWLARTSERYPDKPRTALDRENLRDGEQSQDQLIGLCYRLGVRGQRVPYRERFVAMTREDFPNGLEPADPQAFTGRPADGIFIDKTYALSERAGLRVGDIIVALDGIRVRTRRQYQVVRRFTDTPEMTLLVFRHPGILEIKARAVRRDLHVELRTNHAVNVTPPPGRPS